MRGGRPVPLAEGNCRPSFSHCIRPNPAFHAPVVLTWRVLAAFYSLIRKNGYRFSEKIMLKQRDEIMIRSNRFMI